MEKELYKKMYVMLFNRVSDALEELEKGNPGMARDILMSGQQETEDYFINEAEND